MEKSSGIPWKRGLVEFLIIFAGITISLLADDWRQDREERSRETFLLTSLDEDLIADSLNLANVLESRLRTDSLATWILKALDKAEQPEGTTGAMRSLMLGAFHRPVSATFSGLKAGGELSLIHDDNLRRLLVDYYDVQQPYLAEFWKWFGEFYRPFVVALRRHYLFSLPDSVTTLFPPPLLREVTTWQAVQADLDFTGRIELLGVGAGNAVLRIPDVIQANVELRREIRGYMDEH